jgi:hypothetical protein
VIGEQSARGKRPVARTAETIGEEIRKGTPIKALNSVASATTSLGRSRKTTKSVNSTAGGRKRAKSASRKKTAKKSKAKSAKKATKKRLKKKGPKTR